MFLKCLHCTRQSTLLQITTFRNIRTSVHYFCTYKDKVTASNQQQTIRDRYEPPKKRSLLNAIKDHREKTMVIDEVPENESMSSILKVQRVDLNIPKDFKMVYKFPAIKYFGLMNRIKVYQTVFTVIGPIASAGLYFCGLLSPDYIFVSALLGILGCLTFYSLGYAAAQFVGFIYYNDKTQMVRIAYVDFWGRRKDIEVPVSDIMRRSDCPVGLINKVWFPLKRYSTDERLKLQLEQGIIYDQKALNKIL